MKAVLAFNDKTNVWCAYDYDHAQKGNMELIAEIRINKDMPMVLRDDTVVDGDIIDNEFIIKGTDLSAIEPKKEKEKETEKIVKAESKKKVAPKNLRFDDADMISFGEFVSPHNSVALEQKLLQWERQS